MKNNILILAFVFCTACSDAFDNTSTNHIIFDKDTINIGIVESKAVYQGLFSFTNSSKDTFNVTNVASSCGCIISDYTKSQLIPSQKGEIRFQFTSSKIKGKFREMVIVKFDKSPFLKTLYVVGEVK